MLVAATLLAIGIALIAVWAVRAYNMLGVVEADRAPIIIGVLIALTLQRLLLAPTTGKHYWQRLLVEPL